jgi:hypothetical protein
MLSPGVPGRHSLEAIEHEKLAFGVADALLSLEAYLILRVVNCQHGIGQARHHDTRSERVLAKGPREQPFPMTLDCLRWGRGSHRPLRRWEASGIPWCTTENPLQGTLVDICQLETCLHISLCAA